MVLVMELEILDDNTIDEYLENSELPVFIDFWAISCKPCIKIEPVLKELADQYKGKMNFIKLNVDENMNSSEKFEVMTLPTFLILNKKHSKSEKILGAVSRQKLLEKIDTFLAE
jgi:thioredoxin 1